MQCIKVLMEFCPENAFARWGEKNDYRRKNRNDGDTAGRPFLSSEILYGLNVFVLSTTKKKKKPPINGRTYKTLAHFIHLFFYNFAGFRGLTVKTTPPVFTYTLNRPAPSTSYVDKTIGASLNTSMNTYSVLHANNVEYNTNKW